jgi:hypothetical protein
MSQWCSALGSDDAGAAPTEVPRPDVAGMAPAAPEEVSAVAGMAPETGGKTINLAETAPSPRRSEESSFAVGTASAAACGTTRNMITGPATGMVSTALARDGTGSLGAERAPRPPTNAPAAAARAQGAGGKARLPTAATCLRARGREVATTVGEAARQGLVNPSWSSNVAACTRAA